MLLVTARDREIRARNAEVELLRRQLRSARSAYPACDLVAPAIPYRWRGYIPARAARMVEFDLTDEQKLMQKTANLVRQYRGVVRFLDGTIGAGSAR